jgi:hypothetical protein
MAEAVTGAGHDGHPAVESKLVHVGSLSQNAAAPVVAVAITTAREEKESRSAGQPGFNV